MSNDINAQKSVRNESDRRKTAKIADANCMQNEKAHWIKSADTAKKILRSRKGYQAGAGADLIKFDNPEHLSVFFLDGEIHATKKRKTQQFLSPKAVSERHQKVMESASEHLLAEFQRTGKANLEDISFKLAAEVVGVILGLTNSKQDSRVKHIRQFMNETIGEQKNGWAGVLQRLRQAIFIGVFYWCDVRPAIKARKISPKDDAISFYLKERYPLKSTLLECLTYGTAGMMTTREFIVMAAWYLFEDPALRNRYMSGDKQDQLAILLEILRLEPPAAVVFRRLEEELSIAAETLLPAGERYGIDLRAANVDEALVGECPFTVDPDRAQRIHNSGKYMSFGDGPHSCPGWQVALHETRIFLVKLFQIPGLKLERAPDVEWHAQLKSYKLRNAVITCDRKET